MVVIKVCLKRKFILKNNVKHGLIREHDNVSNDIVLTKLLKRFKHFFFFYSFIKMCI